MSPEFTLVQKVAVWALPVIFAITVHEVSHGYVARLFGDETAARAGRLTLNPVRHVDPIGTLLVPGILLLLGGFLFGWARPVPVDARQLRHPRRDMAIVAAAGPLVNGAMALAWGLLLKLALDADPESGVWTGLRYMAMAGVSINLVLMVLNLLPIPPLDGSRVLMGLLPLRAAVGYARLEPYGLLILILLMATGVLGQLLYWPLAIGEGMLFKLLDINGSALF